MVIGMSSDAAGVLKTKFCAVAQAAFQAAFRAVSGKAVPAEAADDAFVKGLWRRPSCQLSALAFEFLGACVGSYVADYVHAGPLEAGAYAVFFMATGAFFGYGSAIALLSVVREEMKYSQRIAQTEHCDYKQTLIIYIDRYF